MFRLDEERCIKCTLCARDCPIDIIYIDWHQEVNPVLEKKEKVLDRFDIDVQRCMFCGLCEEACPTEPKSIWLTSKTYELATYERWENLYVDMDELQDWKVGPSGLHRSRRSPERVPEFLTAHGEALLFYSLSSPRSR